MNVEMNQRYYEELAVAYVRGRLGLRPDEGNAEQLWHLAKTRAIRLHRFKRDRQLLPRVRRVTGALQNFQPAELLDIGSGRGAFLWPLLDTFSDLKVFSIEHDEKRATELGALRRGGFTRLTAATGDVTQLPLADSTVDCVTALEVLEHLASPASAINELVRVARRAIIVSVPSREDHNPQHLQVFTAPELSQKFLAAGASRVTHDYVHNHLLLFIRL